MDIMQNIPLVSFIYGIILTRQNEHKVLSTLETFFRPHVLQRVRDKLEKYQGMCHMSEIFRGTEVWGML